MVTRIHDVTLRHGIRLGGPQAWKDRPGFTFFQAPTDVQLFQVGAKVNLAPNPASMGTRNPASADKPGVAPVEGSESH